jgi:hypothetical protein
LASSFFALLLIFATSLSLRCYAVLVALFLGFGGGSNYYYFANSSALSASSFFFSSLFFILSSSSFFFYDLLF